MDKFPIRTIGSKVLVLPDKVSETTKSGLILSKTVEERPQKGTVFAVGKTRRTSNGIEVPIEVKVNDKVIFKKFSPDEIVIDEVTYLIMEESDILCIIN